MANNDRNYMNRKNKSNVSLTITPIMYETISDNDSDITNQINTENVLTSIQNIESNEILYPAEYNTRHNKRYLRYYCEY